MTAVESFQEAENIEGIEYSSTLGSSLSEWYESIRNKRFTEFTIDDLCRSVRQNLFVYFLLPTILKVLTVDPFAGELYDCELIISLKAVDSSIWKKSPVESIAIRSIIEENVDKMDEDIKADAVEMIKILS
jgi:hypothetical protein